jgi:hypothetical protein
MAKMTSVAGSSVAIAAIALVATNLWAVAPPCHYTVAADGLTVRDNVMGLIWQRNEPAATYDWADAKAYCTSLSLGSFTSGWRLPEIKELLTLVDWRLPWPGPTIDGFAFPNTRTDLYWSSSAFAGGGGRAWQVNFSNGVAVVEEPTVTVRARCVH